MADVRERDILVAPNEYAYVQDLTKGNIVLYVGPTKISLSNTERMIQFREGRFMPVTGDEAGLGVMRFVEASSSQYIVLENPPEDPSDRALPGANSAVPLQRGRKIVVPGPAEFPLRPGQRAQVVDGHQLRQDEYVVVRVYDDTFDPELPPIGTERIVRGTERSFYVPVSGLEVVPLHGAYVRRAWRMEPSAGLHLRVVKPFIASDGYPVPPGEYEAGQDLFLRGREGVFFPTESLEVVDAVEAIPLAENEGIYVRDLKSGAVRIVEGPTSFLPDPTKEEVVHRALSPEQRALWGVEDPDRAPAIYVPPSTAVMIVAKDRREVVTGPRTRILAFEENLEMLTLSTGRPKTDEEMLPTCFLQIEGNKVSDVVRVETKDHVELAILLSYRVSFVDDPQRWFAVKDYVGLLCDHLSSIIRGSARHIPLEQLYATGTSAVRDAVLGPRSEDGVREGRRFSENQMWVYDVEVLAITILDGHVATLLSDAQRMAIVSEIARKKEELRLGDEQLKEAVSQEIHRAQMTTMQTKMELEQAVRACRVAEAGTQLELDALDTVQRATHEAEAFAVRAQSRQEAAEKRAALDQKRLEARARAFREQMEAMQPELIATLKMLGNQSLAAELSKNLSPLAILGGDSVAAVAERLLDRLPLALGSKGSVADVVALASDVEAAE